MNINSAIASDEIAQRLVRAMQIDRVLAISLQVQIGRIDLKNVRHRKFFECLRSVDTTGFTAILVESISKELSREELHQAIHFYEGPIGRKLVQRDMISIERFVSQKVFGTTSEKSMPEFSEEESAIVDMFRRSPTGRKLEGLMLIESESMSRALEAESQSLLKSCARKTAPS